MKRAHFIEHAYLQFDEPAMSLIILRGAAASKIGSFICNQYRKEALDSSAAVCENGR
ncbi:MAG: hypothetical protein LBU32_18945 [Clostridiales bacterium]|nr:hypothetical protein [Clostridiales bacterium]